MKNLWLLASLAISLSVFGELIDLDKYPQDFVLELKKIEIAGMPYAFNPSIIRWQGQLLMSFRNLPEQQSKFNFNSDLYFIWLDEDFTPASEPQKLDLRSMHASVPCRAEDARLISVSDQLFIVYSDNTDTKITAGGYRMYVGEVYFRENQFTISNIERLSDWEDQKIYRREKNWVPFDYQGELLLTYSHKPHRILRPIFGTETCETLAQTDQNLHWDWGPLRGGSPALKIGDEYLSFFHSQIKMESVHSNGQEMLHYFMGAYTFSANPPFQITKISPEPIWAKGFYHGLDYPRYWGSVRVVFPCGFLDDEDYIWISYGRQDHELWIAKLAKYPFLNSLRPL